MSVIQTRDLGLVKLHWTKYDKKTHKIYILGFFYAKKVQSEIFFAGNEYIVSEARKVWVEKIVSGRWVYYAAFI